MDRHIKYLLAGAILPLAAAITSAQTIDYSVVSVPEEAGVEFVKISGDNDYVAMPKVKRSAGSVSWDAARMLGISPDGNEIAYISARNDAANIFIRDIDRQGASRQRTNRAWVSDFSYSPDGRSICFTEGKGKITQIFLTDARNGYVCRQITSGARDCAPAFSPDMHTVFFTRLEQRGASVWAYDMTRNFLSSYTAGYSPSPSVKTEHAVYVTRSGTDGRGEIWKIHYDTGIEECILSDTRRSFSSPTLSPDGRRLAVVGSSRLENGKRSYWNTDIFTCNTDGTDLYQHTHHAADDLSPAWSRSGEFIYFISRRGSADGAPNIWRIPYTR